MNQLYINWSVNPEIFNIYGFSLRYYGLLFITGLIISFIIVEKIYKNEKLSSQAHEALLVYAVIGIFAGARLGHCFFYDFEYYSKNIIEIFLPIQKDGNGNFYFSGFAGLASHGGAIGLLLALFFYSRRYGISIIKVLDTIAIVAPLAGAFIRIANLMNSEMIGVSTNLPWAFIFVRIDDVPRHPAQLYEAISYMLIFMGIYFLYRKNKIETGKGLYFGLSIFFIFLARILIEFTKMDQADFEKNMLLNMGQVLSIPFVTAGLFIVLNFLLKNNNRTRDDYISKAK